MNVLIFGASGKTGHELVEQGLAQGHVLTAFVRNPAKLRIQHANLRVYRGDVADRMAVEGAIQGQDAVTSALGAASLLSRDPALIVGMHNILTAMEQGSVRRFIYLSADTVHAVRDQLSPVRRYIIVPLILGNTSVDHDVNESMIQQSHLDWVIVRPPMLTNGTRTSVYRSGAHLEARSVIPKISRADLAEFMLKQLTEDRYLCQTPGVMY